MRGSLASLLFALALVAGCVSPPSSPVPTTPEAPTGPRTYPWGISDCSFVIVTIAVDPDRLERYLPEGFQLRNGRLSQLPAGPRGSIDLDAYQCASGVGLNGTLDGVGYGSYYAAVDPPAELKEAGFNAYFVKWDFLVPDAARREVLADGGLPARAGSVAVTLPGGGGAASASLTLEGAGGFRLSGTLAPPDLPGSPLPFMEYTPLGGGGLGRWHARLHDARIGNGAGVVELLPGSWVREVVGADKVPADFIAGTWNLDEADVTFPVDWP